MKKVLAIILALALTVSSAVAVYASDDPRPDVVNPIVEQM
jgi:uncharacterized protein YxeA